MNRLAADLGCEGTHFTNSHGLHNENQYTTAQDMCRIAAEYPQYGWDTNMGYPTAQHYAAIEQFGITPYHRKSFKLFKF